MYYNLGVEDMRLSIISWREELQWQLPEIRVPRSQQEVRLLDIGVRIRLFVVSVSTQIAMLRRSNGLRLLRPIVGGEVAQPLHATRTAMPRTILIPYSQLMHVSSTSSYEYEKNCRRISPFPLIFEERDATRLRLL
jgi:hypothetical protein